MELPITREGLFELVWQKPLSQLAEEYQISNTGLRKICVRFKIPLPSQGHWARIKLGRAFKRPSLPPFHTTDKILLKKRTTGDQVVSEKTFRQNQLITEIKANYESLLSEKEFGGFSHPLYKSLEQDLLIRKGENYGRFNEMWEPSRGELDVRFSRKIQKKALRFLKKLLYIIDHRGHKISIDWGSKTFLVIGEIKLQISLKERLKIVKEKRSTWDTHQYLPTGILFFQYDHFSKKEWTDEKERLDFQLPKILAYLEGKAYELNLERLEQLERQRIKEEAEKKKQQLLDLKKGEFKNFQLLVERANQWKQSQILKEYIIHLSGTPSQQDEAWIKWAMEKAAWLDPTSGHEDELLGKYPPEFPNSR